MRNLIALALVFAACSPSSAAEREPIRTIEVAAPKPAPTFDETEINPRILRRFKSVRKRIDASDTPATIAMTDLGRMLFFDKRLSKHRDLSCNSCHRLDQYGVDHQPTSTGTLGKRGRRNSPTVYHAAGHMRSFWDGRAGSVEEQAKGPILQRDEMAMASPAAVETMLHKIPGYVTAFQSAFPDAREPVTYDHLATAIGAFERSLITPARWDQFLDGKADALTKLEKRGLKLFADVGCVTCHTGEFLGGSTFQKVGAVLGWPNQGDQGRFEVTGVADDRMMFKVPTLRNIAKTAPYFHDGSTATLEQAVRLMAKHQLGEDLADDDVAAIVAWLGSLTGELPLDYIKEPQLPPGA